MNEEENPQRDSQAEPQAQLETIIGVQRVVLAARRCGSEALEELETEEVGAEA